MSDSSTSPVAPGTILEGKFRVLREIGRGGMATVFEAENIDIGKRVAVKVLAAELASSRVVNERFIREARAAASIRSPYICDVFDVGTFDDRPFLVMELLEGESLYDRLTRLRRLDVDETLLIIGQTCKGLAKAHGSSIVHRDLKPENLFLIKAEDGSTITKIVDFGLAKFYEPNQDSDQARLTKEGALFGTPAYMSPEQAKAQGEVDLRCDLWALACIVYEMLTGRTVWNVDQGVAMILAQIAGAPTPRPSRLRPDLPSTFDDWFVRALDRNIERRPRTALEFLESLSVSLKPPEGSIKDAPLHTEEEGELVDSLMDGKAEPQDSPAQDPVATDAPTGVSSLPPPRSRGGVAVVLLLLTAVAAFGGYGVWLYVLNPIPPKKVVFAEAPAPSASAAPVLLPLEAETFALELSLAQEKIAKGQMKAAAAELEATFKTSQAKAVRSVLNHVTTVAEAEGGPCAVTALGHPRQYDSETKSSRPSIALTPKGLVASWTDNHQDTKRRQTYTTLLDDHLRRVTPVLSVTPEAKSVRHPQLLSAAGGIALLFWDYAGESPGVYSRMLEIDGRIATPQRLISSSTRGEQYYPAFVAYGDGYWAFYSETTDPRVQDLFARKLGPQLEPVSAPIRISAYARHGRVSTLASQVAVATSRGLLNVAFSLVRGGTHQIIQLRLDPNDGAALTGVTGPPADAGNTAGADRLVGQGIPLTTDSGKHEQPRIECIEEGCFTVWDDTKAGAFAAFVKHDGKEPLWRREFAPAGARPSLGRRGESLVAVWYEGGRVMLARLGQDGVGAPSVIGKVSGYQPYAEVIAGREPGEWYVAWLDFEAARHEPFVAKAVCGSEQ